MQTCVFRMCYLIPACKSYVISSEVKGSIYILKTIHMYSGITSARVLNGELLYTKILEVNLFAFAYRLFHRDFSPLDGTYCMTGHMQCVPSSGEKSLRNSLQANANKLTSRIFVYILKTVTSLTLLPPSQRILYR